jgi:hypothetical protein
MFANNDQSWLFNCLAGIVLLVLVGIGLSMLVDKRFQFSRNTIALEQEIAADETRLVHLRARKRALSLRFGEDLPKLQLYPQLLRETKLRTADAANRMRRLQIKQADLAHEITATEQSFAALRKQVRQKLWTKAVGERLGNLTTTTGREYKDAVITRITAVGLQISHADGLARIHAPELPPELQDRFQWTAEERLTALQTEERLRTHDR